MGTISIGRDGRERIHTTVQIRRDFRDKARERGISMNRTLELALGLVLGEAPEITAAHPPIRVSPEAVQALPPLYRAVAQVLKEGGEFIIDRGGGPPKDVPPRPGMPPGDPPGQGWEPANPPGEGRGISGGKEMKFICKVCQNEPCECSVSEGVPKPLWPDGCLFPNICGPAKWEAIP